MSADNSSVIGYTLSFPSIHCQLGSLSQHQQGAVPHFTVGEVVWLDR